MMFRTTHLSLFSTNKFTKNEQNISNTTKGSSQCFVFQRNIVSSSILAGKPQLITIDRVKAPKLHYKQKYWGKKKVTLPLSVNFLNNTTIWADEFPVKTAPPSPFKTENQDKIRQMKVKRKAQILKYLYDQNDNDNCKIYFCNLPFFMKEAEFKSTLSIVGKVRGIHYHRDINGAFLVIIT